MNRSVMRWQSDILAISTQFFSSDLSPLHERLDHIKSNSQLDTYHTPIDVELVNTWLHESIIKLVQYQLVPAFWSNFNWLDEIPNLDLLLDKNRPFPPQVLAMLQVSILESLKDLANVQKIITETHNMIVKNQVTQGLKWDRNHYLKYQRFQQFLKHLPHFVVHHPSYFKYPQDLRSKKFIYLPSGIWKKLLFQLFQHNVQFMTESNIDEKNNTQINESILDDEKNKSHITSSHYLNMVHYLHQLGLMESCEDILTTVLLSQIQCKIQTQYQSSYTEPGQLQSLLLWVDNVCIPWLEKTIQINPPLFFTPDGSSPSPSIDNDKILGSPSNSQSLDHPWLSIEEKPVPLIHQFDDFTHSQSSPSSCSDDIDGSISTRMETWKAKLIYNAMESFSNFRMSQIFDIIIDYPDTSSAIIDLRDCLNQTKQYSKLVESCRFVFKKRLLHPGAYTTDIIMTYLCAFKALRELDPSGILVEHALVDIKTYLRQRHDSLRVIILSLFNDDESDGFSLFKEMVNSELSTHLGEEENDDSDDSDEASFIDWLPKPSIAQPGGDCILAYSREGNDTISKLVNVVGSKHLFVSAYEDILSERLLVLDDFNTEKELRNLELLKLKFGEASMQNCEIMLKDIADSKRIHTYVMKIWKQESIDKIKAKIEDLKLDQKENNLLEIEKIEKMESNSQEVMLKTTILTYMFWPIQLTYEKIIWPPGIREQQQLFSTEYIKLRGSRKIEWCDQVGLVELDLLFHVECENGYGEYGEEKNQNDEMEPIRVEFKVSPIQATIISLFQEKNIWKMDDLVRVSGASESSVTKVIQFWCSNGVLNSLENGSYQVVETMNQDETQLEFDEEFDLEEVEEDDISVLEPFVLAMLKNLGDLPLNRICEMATSHMGSEKTLSQMNEFLKTMIQNEQIELNDGKYRLAVK